jgi:hypothetical protein
VQKVLIDGCQFVLQHRVQKRYDLLVALHDRTSFVQTAGLLMSEYIRPGQLYGSARRV